MSGPLIWVNFQSLDIRDERSARYVMPVAVGELVSRMDWWRPMGSYQLEESE